MAKYLLIAGVVAFIWWLMRRGQVERLGRDGVEAAKLLGVSPRASADQIHAAHRARISEAHPDKGGSEDLTQRLNAARDLLLRTRNK